MLVMLMCARCLTAVARAEVEAGFTETVISVASGDRHAAITVTAGEAFCITHWTEHVEQVGAAAAYLRERQQPGSVPERRTARVVRIITGER
jgi:hypothetical protein